MIELCVKEEEGLEVLTVEIPTVVAVISIL